MSKWSLSPSSGSNGEDYVPAHYVSDLGETYWGQGDPTASDPTSLGLWSPGHPELAQNTSVITSDPFSGNTSREAPTDPAAAEQLKEYYQYQQAHNYFNDSGGGLSGFLDKASNIAAPIITGVMSAVIPAMAPGLSAVNAFQGAVNGNPLAAVGALTGIPGVTDAILPTGATSWLGTDQLGNLLVNHFRGFVGIIALFVDFLAQENQFFSFAISARAQDFIHAILSD